MNIGTNLYRARQSLFDAPGDMARRMGELDWSQTPLGPVEGWPQSLRTTASLCLASRFPTLLWWGPELVNIYNDGMAVILGDTHPRALGRPGRDVWPEIWGIVGPMLEGVVTRGEATLSEDQLLLLDRKGLPEECYFTFAYSPIRDESGGIGGAFTPGFETIDRVIGERCRALYGRLAAISGEASSADAACELAAALAPRRRCGSSMAEPSLLDDRWVGICRPADFRTPRVSVRQRVQFASETGFDYARTE